MYTVIIPSAGKGHRSKLEINKMLYKIEGLHLIEYTLEPFIYDKEFTEILLIVAADEVELFRLFSSNKIKLIVGGATRQDSVHQGLLAATNDIVFIHDGARPLVTKKIVQDCKSVMRQAQACVVAIEAVDTIKHYEHGRWQTIDRKDKYLMQTPQCGYTKVLLSAFAQASKEGYTGTDDMEILAKYSDVDIEFVRGSHQNIKVTYPEDFELFKRLKAKDNE
jgi:2-C-methyl-D-erythritol 4-phosphate cytidylyltransferase